MTVSTNIAINAQLEIHEVGDFFRLMESDLPLSVSFFLAGKKLKEAKGVRSGYAEKFEDGTFDKVVITNGATAQDIQYVVRYGSTVLYDVPPIGQVEITNAAGPFAQGAVAVTLASMTVSAANVLRRSGLFINTDPVATIYLNVAGAAASAATGIPLEPGDSWESPAGYCPTGAIMAKSSTATATAIWVEG